MTGKQLKAPSKAERKRIEAAVDAAEDVTGLQICVYIGEEAGTSRADAERLFVATGLVERPALLVLVAPKAHHVEIVTSAELRARVSDEDAARAVAAMTDWFKRGRLAEGLEAGIDVLVDAAGPGETPDDAVELPDLFG